VDTSPSVHGAWDALPYTSMGLNNTIASRDHIAPLGRDQFVKVVYPGYLECTGHRWAWVTEPERLIEEPVDSVARLRKRSYMVAIDEVTTYDNRDLQYTSMRVLPLRTPTLREPVLPESTGTWIWPILPSGEPYQFLIETTDPATDQRPPLPPRPSSRRRRLLRRRPLLHRRRPRRHQRRSLRRRRRRHRRLPSDRPRLAPR
jgi:hypothetical protein